MSAPLSILILESQTARIEAILDELRRDGSAPRWQGADTEATYLARLKTSPDVILVAYGLPQLGPLRALQLAKVNAPGVPLIVLADEIGGEEAAECIKQGAADLLSFKHLAQLRQRIYWALQQKNPPAPPAEPLEMPYHAIVDMFQDGIWWLSAEGTVLYVNQGMAEMLGYTPQEIVRRPLFDFMDESGRILAEKHLERRKHGIKERYDFRFRRKDGSDLWAIVSTSPLIADEGNHVGGFGMLVNIPSQRQIGDVQFKSEVRFRAAAEGSLDAFYILQCERNENRQIVDFVFTYLNAKTETQLFTPRERLLGQRLCELFSSARQDGRFESYVRVVETGQPLEGEYFVPEKEKAPGWYYHQIIPLEDGVAVTNRDITGRKQIEKSLRRMGNKFRRFIEQSPDGMLLIDERGTIVEWNQALEQISGLTRAEVMARPAWEIPHVWVPDMLHLQHPSEYTRHAVTEVLTTGRGDWLNHLFESDQHRPDGSIQHLQKTYFAVQIDDEFMIGGLIRDVTEQKQADTILRQSEERFAKAFRANPIPMAVARVADMLIVDMNDSFIKLIGYAPDEPLNREPLTLQTWAGSEAYTNFRQTLDAQGYVREMELQIPTRSGEIRDCLVYVESVTLNNEPSLILMAHDITARKQLEKQTVALAVERSKFQVFESFIHDASHDFRTPLSVLKTSIYLLDRYADQVSDQTAHLKGAEANITPSSLAACIASAGEAVNNIRKQVATLKSGSQRLENLVEGLLEITRLEHLPRFAFVLRNLNVITEGLVEMHRPLATEKRQSLQFQPDENQLFVRMDEREFGRAIQNLLENALNYTPEEGRITVRTYQEDQEVVVEIKDTGVGIAEADLPHIFERFYRADKSRSSSTGGTGLGLPIAKRIVEAHRGRIEVASVQGQGSTFRVFLPL